ncbi:MAG: hypothetical protein LBO67_03400 [Spirochaetaceae bacterium]|jgi:hypothetical protein|nr:hypothetical protein [Spirochaetaceae bacterium]
MITYNAIIRLRLDTESNWILSNRVLEPGEIGVVSAGTHANMIKVGNGISSWIALPYIRGDIEQITAQVNLLLTSKLDKIPDSVNAIIGTDGKINPHYLPDSILGQMVYGGVFGTNGIISASSYAPALDGVLINTVQVGQYPGYYFIAQDNYTFSGLAFNNGDWAVCQGNHAPAWIKIDNSDDVSSVNGRKGAVVITKADVGLEKVDNTSDLEKPVSAEQQAAIEAAVTAEAQTRTAADTALQENINAETSRAMGTESTLSIAVNAEVQARIAADTTLQENISTETTRASGAENQKVDKHADHTNGSTDITISPDNDGFSVHTAKADTQTMFGFETNTESGNPTIGGITGRKASSPSEGSRRLIFATDNGGNIKLYLRKDKDVLTQAADINDDDLVLNKGEIQAIVNDIMAALSQGLKTPGVIAKESELPAAADAPNGTYYVVQDLDVTAAGQQGRVWKNDTLSQTEWQVVIDKVFAPDEQWISLDTDGALTVADVIKTLINGALQGSQVEQTLPDTDSADDEQKLISRRAAFGLVPKQQDAADAGKAMVIGIDGKFTPGISGKVDSIDGLEPVADTKNVKLSYVYDTEAEFNADSENIPVGARVIKLWEFPPTGIPMLIPDYAHIETINRLTSISSSFTVTSFGFVKVMVSKTYTENTHIHLAVKINNTEVCRVWGSFSGNGESMAILPVNVGDVITVQKMAGADSVSQSCLFIPPKTVIV